MHEDGRRRRALGRVGLLAAIAALVGLLGLPPGTEPRGNAAGAAPAQESGGNPAQATGVLEPGGSWTVTLLTGEVVDVRSDAEGRVTAGVRDQPAPFRTVRRPDGELYVIPLAVTPLLDRVLDLELFNVTGLVRQGYDDASLPHVPVIVQREPGVDVASTLAASPDERPLPSIGAVATSVPKGGADATGGLLADLAEEVDPTARSTSVAGVTKVWLDRRIEVSSAAAPSAPAPAPAAAGQPADGLDANLTQVGADDAWEAGLTGAGITVAVLDTGVDATHPDLAGKVVAEENFGGSEDAVDRNGHGTHVASIVAGTGSAAAGARRGVAPDASLISGKVVDDFGWGFESEAIAGMEWAAPQADVVNMSLGYGGGSDGTDPMSLALDTLSDQHDTLFVVAAGNSGPLSRTVEFPGSADRALTVGAVDVGDAVADFSSRGPLVGTYELKPEVMAPGVDIVAARAGGTTIGEPVGDHYVTASGTSMASPHVAGAAAVLTQLHPDWTAQQMKNAVVASSDPVAADGYDAGAGRIDVGDGVDAGVRAEHDVVDVALADPRTEPHTQAMTWTNTGDEPVTVALGADLVDREGEAVDAVTVEPSELTIAAGATGTATLTVDGPALDVGLYSGVVTADPEGDGDDEGGDGPDDDLRTPVAVHAAPDTVELTIEATAPAGTGEAPPFTFAAIVNLDDYGEFGDFRGFEDTTTLEVPVGRYAVVGDVSSQVPDAEVVAQVGDPAIDLTEDTTVAFDGAAAVPFDPTVDGVETAPPMHGAAGLVVTPESGTGGFGLLTEVYAWPPRPPLRLTPMEGDEDSFAAYQVFRLQAPHLTTAIGGEPVGVTEVVGHEIPAGERTLTAVDAGDGSDLAAARGELAVVTLPADPVEREAVTQRAVEAGVGVLAFVDERREVLTLDGFGWGDVPVVSAVAEAASALRTAAAAGEPVTLEVTASPYVYDIVTPAAPVVDPALVIDRSEQRDLATLRERFHRDADGRGATDEHRYPISVTLMSLATEGPLPERRTAYVTPDVTWQSIADGSGFMRRGDEMVPVDNLALSMDSGVAYESGSRTTLRWLRRPQWPGPVGGPLGASYCQPTPVLRTPGTIQAWLSPFQDGPDRSGCADPDDATLTLERDGTVIGSVDTYAAEFPVPAEAGTYRLSYDQTGRSPYAHRSSTVWTFRSEAPAGGSDDVPLPLLVVDYDLPLDTLNRPTERHGEITVRQVSGTEPRELAGVEAWTSTDGGATWRSASARDQGDGSYRITLPRAGAGTPVSLRVDARDVDGNRIEQSLYDAYTG